MDETTLKEAIEAVEGKQEEEIIHTTEETLKKNSTKKEKDFVSKEEFNSLKDNMNKSFEQIISLIKDKPSGIKIEATKKNEEDKKINEANSDVSDFNPRYDSKAREVLGEKIERTFLTYPKGGGTFFTIVIKKEFSNSPKDYLERMKEDRRTVNIEREEYRGEDGVEKWAKLILTNLNRTLR